MADIGDFSLDTPEITAPPALQARIMQMEEEIGRSHEQLTEGCMLVVTLAAN